MVVEGMQAVHLVPVDKPVDHMVLGSGHMAVGARAAQMAVMKVNEAVEQMVVGGRAVHMAVGARAVHMAVEEKAVQMVVEEEVGQNVVGEKRDQHCVAMVGDAKAVVLDKPQPVQLHRRIASAQHGDWCG